MNEELSKNTTDSESTTDTAVDKESVQQPYRTFNTEEDLKRYVQSERSKAKCDLLKEFRSTECK